MKKKITAIIASLVLVASSFTAAVAEEPIKVYVEGNEVQFEGVAPFIENERTLVPMRAIFEALGATVDWNGDTKTITARDLRTNIGITMIIDSEQMVVDGMTITLEVPAKIVNDGYTVVPLRAISESMQCTVDWNGDSRTVSISRAKAPGGAGTGTPGMTTPGMTTPPDTANTGDTPQGGTASSSPWQTFESLEALNEVMQQDEEIPYTISGLTLDSVEIASQMGYKYMKGSRRAELTYSYSASESSGASVIISTQPGADNILSTAGRLWLETYSLDGKEVAVYQSNSSTYALWKCESFGQTFSHCVEVQSYGLSEEDTRNFLKSVVENFETNHPRG